MSGGAGGADEPAARGGTRLARVGALATSRVREGALVRLERPPFHVLVTRVGGQLYAIEDACPHSGWSLCEGSLDGHVLTCAGHGWRIDVRDGAVLTEAGRGERNPVFRVREQGDWVLIERPDPGGTTPD